MSAADETFLVKCDRLKYENYGQQFDLYLKAMYLKWKIFLTCWHIFRLFIRCRMETHNAALARQKLKTSTAAINHKPV